MCGTDNVSRETLSKLTVFIRLLEKWNRRINLVSRADQEDIIDRHLVDSLELFPFMNIREDFIDIGSGGGFPGIVTAIVTGKPGYLVESDKRKVIFLREAIRETGISLNVWHGRIEACTLEPTSTLTARALAPLDRLLDLGAHLIKKGGVGLFLKGRKADEEIHKAKKIWQADFETFPSSQKGDGVIVCVSHIEGKIG